MATGTIARLQPERGFGFITPDGAARGGDLFFHATAVEGVPFERLQPGQRVAFDEEPDPRDPARRRAVRVRPLAGP